MKGYQINAIKKNTVLLLGHDPQQEWVLSMTLRLGGYTARVVKGHDEVINLVKMLPEAIHSVILAGAGLKSVLISRLEIFSRNHIDTPVCLLGGSVNERDISKSLENTDFPLRLFFCGNDRLLECLRQNEPSTRESVNILNPETASGDESVSLQLVGALTGREIDAARRELSEVVGVARHIIICCQGLEKLDGQGLRFLCSAHRYITSRARICEFSGLSPSLVGEARSEVERLRPRFFCNQSNDMQCIWR